MARSRSPNREKARMYWLSSGGKTTNTEIAEHLGVSTKSIERWKKEDRWELSQNRQNSRPKKGAPYGNKNAVGHGAPKGNINNLVSGKYSKRYWDFVNEDEIDMLSELDDEYFENEERLLMDQIKLYTIRERRFMEIIQKIKEKSQEKAGMIITENTIFTIPDENTKKPIVTKTVAHTEIKEKMIVQLEEQLSRVQEKKTRTILALNDVRNKRLKLEIEVDKVDTTLSDVVQIYLPDNKR